jgi:transcription elongation GreA/GreB family factor
MAGIDISPATVPAPDSSITAAEEIDSSTLLQKRETILELDAAIDGAEIAPAAEALVVETRVVRDPADLSSPTHVTNLRSAGVVVGDTILLRFTDGGPGKFIRYTIRHSENDPSRGVLSVGDPRAQQMLGKELGSEIALELVPKHRTAVIESITGENRPEKRLVEVSSPTKKVVETGDTVVLRYFVGQQPRFYQCVLKPTLMSGNGSDLSRKQERAHALLGKKVGDEFTVWLGSYERPVRIDRILKP